MASFTPCCFMPPRRTMKKKTKKRKKQHSQEAGLFLSLTLSIFFLVGTAAPSARKILTYNPACVICVVRSPLARFSTNHQSLPRSGFIVFRSNLLSFSSFFLSRLARPLRHKQSPKKCRKTTGFAFIAVCCAVLCWSPGGGALPRSSPPLPRAAGWMSSQNCLVGWLVSLPSRSLLRIPRPSVHSFFFFLQEKSLQQTGDTALPPPPFPSSYTFPLPAQLAPNTRPLQQQRHGGAGRDGLSIIPHHRSSLPLACLLRRPAARRWRWPRRRSS